MSEHLLKIKLSELVTIRLICHQCGSTVEMPVERLESLPKHAHCTACNALLLKRDEWNTQEDFLALLAKAIRGLNTVGQEVQFIIPTKD